MIESYLRANKMFVDYSEVCYVYIVLGSLYLKCLLEPGLTEIFLLCSPKWRECTHHIWSSIFRMLIPVSLVQRGNDSSFFHLKVETNYSSILVFCIYYTCFFSIKKPT